LFRRTLDDQEICDVLATLDTADLPSRYPLFIHASRARRSEFTRVNSLLSDPQRHGIDPYHSFD
jgi:hypothetical protein